MDCGSEEVRCIVSVSVRSCPDPDLGFGTSGPALAVDRTVLADISGPADFSCVGEMSPLIPRGVVNETSGKL